MDWKKKSRSPLLPRLLGMPLAQGLAILYLIIAGFWIFLSDWLAEVVSRTETQLRFISTYKGWFFVFITSAMLFLILSRFLAKIKLTQQQLRTSEERFKLAADAGRIGIWDRDIASGRLIWDDRMYALYGIRKEDFGGAYDAWKQCLHPDDLARAIAEVEAAERGKKPFDTEFRIVRPDGEIRHIRAFGKVVCTDKGAAQRMIGINYDITDSTRMEQKIQVQLDELSRWHQVTLGRETRVVELKKEINEILRESGKPPRYN